MTLLQSLGIELPIIQAPMAGVSSPALAAAVSKAGALGSIGVGSTDAQGARRMIAAVRERARRPLNVNVFCHQPAKADPSVESAWLEYLRPYFARFDAKHSRKSIGVSWRTTRCSPRCLLTSRMS